MKLYEHSKDECRQVVVGTKELIQQIANIEDKELRKQVCESAIEMCDRLINDGKEVRK